MRICRDCRQEIPRDERPEDHLCIGDREPDSPAQDDDGEGAAA